MVHGARRFFQTWGLNIPQAKKKSNGKVVGNDKMRDIGKYEICALPPA